MINWTDLIRMPISLEGMVRAGYLDEDCGLFLKTVEITRDINLMGEEPTDKDLKEFKRQLEDQISVISDSIIDYGIEDIDNTVVAFTFEFNPYNNIMDEVNYVLNYGKVMRIAKKFYKENGYHEVRDFHTFSDEKIIHQAFVWDGTSAGRKVIEQKKARASVLSNKALMRQTMLSLIDRIIEHNGGRENGDDDEEWFE